jgi:hypothetical protein
MKVLLFFLLLVPVSFMTTIILRPFWNLIEFIFKIEAIGHSGPREWCYAAVYLILLLVVSAAIKFFSHIKKRSSTPRT